MNDEPEDYQMDKKKENTQRQQRMEEAKFGDFQNKLVKRPTKDFLWGYGTQIYDDSKGKLFTICNFFF